MPHQNMKLPSVGEGHWEVADTGFKNSFTLLCTCRDIVFEVAYGCVSPSSALPVSPEGYTPFSISQQQELGRLGARTSGSKGVACDS